MKTCCNCKKSKEENNFGKDNYRKDRLTIYCKSCQKIKANEPKRKTYCKLKRNQRVVRARLFIIEYYKLHPCSCGETRFPCLQANHIDPYKKEYNISDMVDKGLSIVTIQKELDKCIIMCANCHACLTAVQFGWYKNLKDSLGMELL